MGKGVYCQLVLVHLSRVGLECGIPDLLAPIVTVFSLMECGALTLEVGCAGSNRIYEELSRSRAVWRVNSGGVVVVEDPAHKRFRANATPDHCIDSIADLMYRPKKRYEKSKCLRFTEALSLP